MRCLVVVLTLCLAAIAGVAAAEIRVALVIGNARYAAAPPLANPGNDAGDIAAALEETGFEVARVGDAGFDGMRRALAAFGDRAARADVAVIYFAGHGIELDRRNYLLPIDAELANPLDVAFEAVPLDLARRAAEPARRLSLVIIDACRTNPFLAQMEASGRSLSRGLARVAPVGQDALVAFAAREGTIAEDGEGRNSPYAQALVRALREPELEIGKLFRRVRDDVVRATGGRQEPALYGSLSEADFYFRPPSEPEPEARGLALVTPGTAASVGASPLPQPQRGGAVEVAFWTAIAGSTDPRDFEDYLARFPEGVFAGLARRRLEQFGADAAEPRVAALPEPVAPAPPVFVPSRAEVRSVQERLNILGFDAGPVDGWPGRRTSRAVARWQRQEGLAGDGAITAETVSRLETVVPASRVKAHRAELARAAEAARAAREAERARAAEAGEIESEAASVGPPEPEATPPEEAEPARTGSVLCFGADCKPVTTRTGATVKTDWGDEDQAEPDSFNQGPHTINRSAATNNFSGQASSAPQAPTDRERRRLCDWLGLNSFNDRPAGCE